MRIYRDVFDALLFLAMPPISGGSVDLGGAGYEDETDIVPPSDVSAGEPTAGAGGVGEGAITVDGQQYTLDQVKTALGALSNKSTWETGLKQREMGLADLRERIEGVTGKRIDQLTEDDLEDLAAFGILNKRLRRDEGFRRAWFSTFNRLAEEYERAGATPLQAERAAGARIARAQQTGEQPQEVKPDGQIGQRMGRMENWAARREIRDLQDYTSEATAATLEQVGKGLESWHGEIADLMLAQLQNVDDPDLLAMMYDGRLARWIGSLADYYVKRFKTKVAGADQTKQGDLVKTAQDLARAKQGAPPVPVGGGPTVPGMPAIPEPVKGGGLKHLHRRLEEAIRE